MNLDRSTEKRFGAFWRDERGQDGFEYLLIIGLMSVGIVAAIAGAGGLIDTVVGFVVAAITVLF